MFGVKYCRRPAMAEVVRATKTKITERLMLSGREAGRSVHFDVIFRLELVSASGRVSASMLKVSECSCSLHPLRRDLDCSRASTPPSDSLAQSPRVAKCIFKHIHIQKR